MQESGSDQGTAQEQVSRGAGDESVAWRRGGKGYFTCNWLLLIIPQLMKGNSRQIIKNAENMPRPG